MGACSITPISQYKVKYSSWYKKHHRAGATWNLSFVVFYIFYPPEKKDYETFIKHEANVDQYSSIGVTVYVKEDNDIKLCVIASFIYFCILFWKLSSHV